MSDKTVATDDDELLDDDHFSLPGEVAWTELVTPDVEASRGFYTELLGWTSSPFGEGMEYELFENDGESVAGMMKAQQPGMPAMWLPYVAVEDIAASLARAAELGAKVCFGPMPVPEVGQIAVLTDPQGATFGLMQPEDECEGCECAAGECDKTEP